MAGFRKMSKQQRERNKQRVRLNYEAKKRGIEAEDFLVGNKFSENWSDTWEKIVNPIGFVKLKKGRKPGCMRNGQV